MLLVPLAIFLPLIAILYIKWERRDCICVKPESLSRKKIEWRGRDKKVTQPVPRPAQHVLRCGSYYSWFATMRRKYRVQRPWTSCLNFYTARVCKQCGTQQDLWTYRPEMPLQYRRLQSECGMLRFNIMQLRRSAEFVGTKSAEQVYS